MTEMGQNRKQVTSNVTFRSAPIAAIQAANRKPGSGLYEYPA